MWTYEGIQCANCGEVNLHQYLLESFTRSAEDSCLGRRQDGSRLSLRRWFRRGW
jgi:hypothetical protein